MSVYAEWMLIIPGGSSITAPTADALLEKAGGTVAASAMRWRHYQQTGVMPDVLDDTEDFLFMLATNGTVKLKARLEGRGEWLTF